MYKDITLDSDKLEGCNHCKAMDGSDGLDVTLDRTVEHYTKEHGYR